MKTKNSVTFLSLAITLVAVGCQTSTPEATPEQKKAFMGSAMPKGFQSGPPSGAAAAADKARADAMANHQ